MGRDLEEILKYASQDVLDINQEILPDTQNRGASKIGKSNKFNAQKTEVDGRKFHSKAEARHYIALRDMERDGQIEGLECQPKFVLLREFINNQGLKVRKVTYAADFMYYDRRDGLWHIVDVKSEPTAKSQLFMFKWKMMQNMFQDDMEVVLEIVLT